MVRESGISATKPLFPTYLLPNIRFALPRRRASSASYLSSPDDSAGSSAATTPENSPPTHDNFKTRIARTAPDTLRCSTCSTELAFASQIISKGFTGRHGRAYLVAPKASSSLLNIRVGKSENRQLVTGWHIVADISCAICSTKIGWKYVDAKEASQKYKVGKFILETERIVTYRQWEDVARGGSDAMYEKGDGGNKPVRADDEEIEFDSEDEDECEDVFAGTWDAEVVAKRRSTMVTRGNVNTE
ncbi:hypothetical protein S40285_10533 [Stachybotrys chlorohalonatus IBT 40285]|uniref:Yippee domain-containing protein n=1 Tax=Stachybotrys chlorohalonatus (strain IBT 40285) TaxID=1283841 RepID=A0A084Q8L6_STAC4|nr:hypothetical protein S40285_10533 [Stachybotrys chlorohalonata IBT 40285]